MQRTLTANSPMSEWDAIYQEMGLDERQEIERKAAQEAEHYARLSAYLSRRMSGGKHEHAVKAQNVVAGKVRVALGYTLRRADITF